MGILRNISIESLGREGEFLNVNLEDAYNNHLDLKIKLNICHFSLMCSKESVNHYNSCGFILE
jgi:hypothetical protein